MSRNLQKLVGERKKVSYSEVEHDKPMSRLSAYSALKRRVKVSEIDKNIRPHTFRHHWITSKA